MVKHILSTDFNPQSILCQELIRSGKIKKNYFNKCFLAALAHQQVSICDYFINNKIININTIDFDSFSPSFENPYFKIKNMLNWIYENQHPLRFGLSSPQGVSKSALRPVRLVCRSP